MSRPFTPTEPGTDEVAWLGDSRWDAVPVLDAAALHADRVIVLAAHPDDETLGVGALVADLAARGTEIHVVVATDGEGSHPDSSLWSPERLAAVRRDELATAVAGLAPGAQIHHLGLPDGGLGDLVIGAADDLARRIAAVLPPVADAAELFLAPYEDDGHVDHDTLGRAVARLAHERGARHLTYPIWLWQWATPDELPWDRAVQVQVSARALHAKAGALAHHRSQVAPLSPLPGDEVLLPEHVLTRFARVVETLFTPEGAARPDLDGAERERRESRAAGFDAMLGARNDPWDSTSDYERRKHDLTVALLTRPRYGHVAELGCSTGALTERLAARADRVTGVDGSARALAVARRRDLDVDWRQAELPYALADLAIPDHSVDLVVVSEVLYFLTGPEVLSLARHVRRLLAPGGEVVVVDWLPGSDSLPLDGALVHAQLRRVFADLPHRVHLREESIEADVWGGRPLRPGADG